MSLKRSLAWMALAQGCSLVMQFAASVVLARYLTPYETGIYAVALAMVGILALMQALGLHSLIVREENLTQEIQDDGIHVERVHRHPTFAEYRGDKPVRWLLPQ